MPVDLYRMKKQTEIRFDVYVTACAKHKNMNGIININICNTNND